MKLNGWNKNLRFLKINELIKILLIVGVFWMGGLLGCSSEPGPDPLEIDEPEEVVLSPDVRLLEYEPNLSTVEVQEDRLQFTFAEATDVDVTVGSILVGETEPGYLRRVTEVVESSATSLVVETEQATFTDVIEDGRVHFDTAELEETEQGVVIQPLSLSHTTSMNETLVDTPDFTLKTSGTLALNLDFEFDLDIVNSSVAHFSTGATGTANLDYTASATAGASLSTSGQKNIQVAAVPFKFFVPTPLGPLPILGTIDVIVTVEASGEINATGTLSTGISGNASLGASIEYAGGTWSQNWSPIAGSSSLKPIDWTVEGNASIQASVAPDLQVNFYGVGGPRVGFKRYMEFSGIYLPCPPNYTVHHGESADVSLHIDVPIIDATLTHTFASTDQRWLLDSGEDSSAPCCGDGTLHEVEECDGDSLRGATCESQGLGGGTLSCDDECSFDVSECVCGNGQIDADEQCDGSDFGEESCESLMGTDGMLACTDDCTIDTTPCTCGNGTVDVGEDCDGSALNSQTCDSLLGTDGELACNSDCSFDTAACTCGNDVIDAGEVCDGSNLDDETCETQDFESGTLNCDDDCGSFDTSECEGKECTSDDNCAAGEICDSGECVPFNG